MPKKTENGFDDIEDLILPAMEDVIQGFVLPDIDEDGKCILKNIPDLNLEKKRTAEGYTTFFSLYSGSTGSSKEGYKASFDKSGRIMIAGKDGKTWITYLDLLELIKLVGKELEFVKYQIIRNRADIKEEIFRKSRFTS